ncbi:MAG: electron transport complex subunit RsxC [Pseudomonadales bacterium]|jgi:electron transport complex protein RnfC
MNLFPRRTFHHGVHPDPEKAATRDLPIHRFPFAPLLAVPLAQHAGTPARPVVREGQEVRRGEKLGEADGEISAAVHAPASGVVRRLDLVPSPIGRMVAGVYLEPWPGSTQEVADGTACPLETATPEEIVDAIRDAGVVGLGGAAFPTHVKLRVEPARVDTIVINGAECEPYLTTDYRVMLEQTDDLVLGIRYVLKATGATRAILAVEHHARDVLNKVRPLAPGMPLTLRSLEVKYPQGAEKILIKTLLDREVPSGRLPVEVGVICINAATVAEIGRLLPHGRGILERVVTFAGSAIERKGNYRIPIGTPLRFALEEVGTTGDVSRVLLGGPMMGQAIGNLDVPITKGISGVIALTGTPPPRSYPCIHCGRCLEACPLDLNPAELGALARAGEHERMAAELHLNDCFECGACSFVCPSHLPLVQEFRAAKQHLRRIERLLA